MVGVLKDSTEKFTLLGRSKKDPYPTHRGNSSRPGKGGGKLSKNVLNLYRMSGEVDGGILLISSVGGMFSGPTHLLLRLTVLNIIFFCIFYAR